jgi:hypothetical protein
VSRDCGNRRAGLFGQRPPGSSLRILIVVQPCPGPSKWSNSRAGGVKAALPARPCLYLQICIVSEFAAIRQGAKRCWCRLDRAARVRSRWLLVPGVRTVVCRTSWHYRRTQAAVNNIPALRTIYICNAHCAASSTSRFIEIDRILETRRPGRCRQWRLRVVSPVRCRIVPPPRGHDGSLARGNKTEPGWASAGPVALSSACRYRSCSECSA